MHTHDHADEPPPPKAPEQHVIRCWRDRGEHLALSVTVIGWNTLDGVIHATKPNGDFIAIPISQYDYVTTDAVR